MPVVAVVCVVLTADACAVGRQVARRRKVGPALPPAYAVLRRLRREEYSPTGARLAPAVRPVTPRA